MIKPSEDVKKIRAKLKQKLPEIEKLIKNKPQTEEDFELIKEALKVILLEEEK